MARFIPTVDYLNVPFEERMKLATHYKLPGIEPNSSVRVGMVKRGLWIDLYIALHKQEAKRKGLIEYKRENKK